MIPRPDWPTGFTGHRERWPLPLPGRLQIIVCARDHRAHTDRPLSLYLVGYPPAIEIPRPPLLVVHEVINLRGVPAWRPGAAVIPGLNCRADITGRALAGNPMKGCKQPCRPEVGIEATTFARQHRARAVEPRIGVISTAVGYL